MHVICTCSRTSGSRHSKEPRGGRTGRLPSEFGGLCTPQPVASPRRLSCPALCTVSFILFYRFLSPAPIYILFFAPPKPPLRNGILRYRRREVIFLLSLSYMKESNTIGQIFSYMYAILLIEKDELVQLFFDGTINVRTD